MGKISTEHNIYLKSSAKMQEIEDNSVALVVTSPPYPMIEMWDTIFSEMNPDISLSLKKHDGRNAFNLMHKELDAIWKEIERVLLPGGFVCINIGDATRTINKEFILYPNHAKIIESFLDLGFSNLPNILWRKQTNAPNKFMGSGMLPAGAYVTLEHEWILIFRKGTKRQFSSEKMKQQRKESAYFWEERNNWFSDLWDLKGTKQVLNNSDTRKRSAAFPFEIPYRLINMFSIRGDMVLDPFLGTGTTVLAAISLGRNSLGYEIDDSLTKLVLSELRTESLNSIIEKRIEKHKLFIENRLSDAKKSTPKHYNENLKMPVITSQEKEIQSYLLNELNLTENSNRINISANYSSSSIEGGIQKPVPLNDSQQLYLSL